MRVDFAKGSLYALDLENNIPKMLEYHHSPKILETWKFCSIGIVIFDFFFAFDSVQYRREGKGEERRNEFDLTLQGLDRV